jgi:aspartyl-tRNA(Asn)/glutamyl-tRNA(Gln) amidotransferase subunit C
MSSISLDDAARLAQLARIDLEPGELAHLATQLDAIVTAVATVSEVAGDDVPATSHPIPLVNIFRDDVVCASLTPAEALASAPEAENNQFKVPQILGEEP